MTEEARDIFLSADERYDIWEIKRAERPQLLEFEIEVDDFPEDGDGNDDHDHHQSRSAPAQLPLVDGCDLKGWRHAKMVKISGVSQGYLNVGSGCPLMRLESQLPVLSSRAFEKWRVLQGKLLQPPAETALRIPDHESTNLSMYPWFERDNVPVILEGLAKTWKANESCTFDRLVKNFGELEWRFSDTHGRTMTLSTYRKYIHSLEGESDDAPLAVYDSQLDADHRKCLLDDYRIPECFAAPDLFECLGDEERPPYRWILIGPARSGTGVHIDPLGTHAWVTLLEGAKRWVLFPYGTDEGVIGMQDPQIPSALWFSQEGGWYKRAMEQVPGAVEILQLPGDTVYVPSGWPHLVLNLHFSTAITQNYATEYPCFHRISQSVQKEEPSMFIEWKEKLRQKRPDLFAEHSTRLYGDDRENTSVNYCAQEGIKLR